MDLPPGDVDLDVAEPDAHRDSVAAGPAIGSESRFVRG
jgi:hypothetical protein